MADESLVAKWENAQMEIAKRALIDDASFPFSIDHVSAGAMKAAVSCLPRGAAAMTSAHHTTKPPLRLVGGLDISFVPHTNEAVSSLAILSFPSMDVLHTAFRKTEMKVPYIPGYLAFREIPSLLELLAEVKATKPELFPEVLVLDGNGVHHPRRCGIATHLGVVLDVPTIGCAKKVLAVDGLSRETVARQFADHMERSAAECEGRHVMMPLHGQSGQLWGYAALTGNSVTRPIYISPGHRMSYPLAGLMVLLMCKNRVVEPVRQADLLSRALIRSEGRAEAVDED